MRNQILIVLLPLVLAACACAPKTPEVAEPPPVAEPVLEPDVGTKQLQDESSVWQEYQCGKKTLPFLVLERNEISSSTLRPGEDFRHRFVYALCPAAASKPIRVALSRTITRLGNTLVRDADKHYELKPGRWAVNALVKLHRKLPPGTYNLRINLTDPQVAVEGAVPFVVEKKR